MNINIEQTRELLINAGLASAGAELSQRNAFSMLLNEMRGLRNKGYSFAQISELLEESELALCPSTIKSYFNELHFGLHQDLENRMSQILEHISLESTPNECEIEPHTEIQDQNYKLHCLPLETSCKSLPRREDVPEAVYNDGQIEHPAIQGLMLSRDERMYGAFLEFEENGKIRIETVQEKAFRIKWKTPIPMTETATGKNFVKMDNSLFVNVGKNRRK
ncbi:MAG: hypothetical protein WC426_01690 [Sulfuriferula sp.]